MGGTGFLKKRRRKCGLADLTSLGKKMSCNANVLQTAECELEFPDVIQAKRLLL